MARSLLNLGWLYYNDSQFEKAEGIYKRSLAILEKTLGPDHPDVADNLSSLGALCLWLRRYKESGDHYQRALAIKEKVYGPDHPRVADAYDSLGLLHEYQRQWGEARADAEKALAILEKDTAPESFKRVEALLGMSRCARLSDDRETALKYLVPAEALCEKEGETDPTTWGMVLTERAWHLFYEDKDLAGAEAKLKKALELIGSELSPASLEYRDAARECAAVLRAAGRADEAKAIETKIAGRISLIR